MQPDLLIPRHLLISADALSACPGEPFPADADSVTPVLGHGPAPNTYGDAGVGAPIATGGSDGLTYGYGEDGGCA
jgi:hypothetical protein